MKVSGIGVWPLRHGNFKKFDALFFEHFFFFLGTDTADVARLFDTVMDFQCFFCKVAPDVVEIFLHKIDYFFANFFQVFFLERNFLGYRRGFNGKS